MARGLAFGVEVDGCHENTLRNNGGLKEHAVVAGLAVFHWYRSMTASLGYSDIPFRPKSFHEVLGQICFHVFSLV